ncbi:hypothetical protein [Novosphingobium sp. Leaf2]|uniref:hypothetical protein n=1 Tax=Novosphingobium sp. Leaf2 TaxID=1735670 RepID=UPI0006FA1CE5|nr:hypothetical protein [Novosphingobium sp. Leaf2]KQM18259.1 hypothetical protein ASE49_08510 [Novosphingobium sp. Leaf2]
MPGKSILAVQLAITAGVLVQLVPTARADEGTAVQAPSPTRILDRKAAQRLRANKGLTLQWIDWGNSRGSAYVRTEGGAWTLRGAEAEADGPGRLLLDGTITEIGADYFTFTGRIRIRDTPDAGRVCDKNKTWHFAITQKRSYYRLREFEWCDGLTDYIDIHF